MRITMPSVQLVGAAARQSARRFPFVLVAAIVTTVAAIVLTGPDTGDWRGALLFMRIAVAGSLGLPLLFAVAVFRDVRGWRGVRMVALHAAVLAVLAAIAYAWGDWTDTGRAWRYALFSAAFHLAAASVCWTGRDAPNGFWQYNRALFMRLVTTALYAAVLFAGLAAALGAINVLFSAHIEERTFMRLFIVDALVFGTWFFVAGVPEPLEALNTRTDYPDGLRRFAQFVLVPLVLAYLAILTVYLGKVLVTREWPNGWIGYLVSFVSVSGILAWLLVWPLDDRQGFGWIRGYIRGFFVALVPSIGMLWVALFKRVEQYGLTETRAIALAGALWLSGIAVFYIVSRSRNIKVIPSTLCVLALLISTGPLSVFALARGNQRQRLETVMLRNGMLVNGHFTRSTRAVADSDVTAISEMVWYLRDAHGAHVLDAWLPDTTRARVALGDTLPQQQRLVEREAELVVAALGVPYRRNPRRPLRSRIGKEGESFEFQSSAFGPFELEGFRYVTTVNAFRTRQSAVAVGSGVVLRIARDSSRLEFVRDSAVVVSVALDSTIARAGRESGDSALANGVMQVTSVPAGARAGQTPLVIDAEGGGVRVRLLLSRLIAQRRGGVWRVGDFSGAVLLARVDSAR